MLRLRPAHLWLGSALLVLVVAAPPRLREFESVFVPAQRGDVEKLVGPHQRLDATGVGGVRVVDSAVLQREDARSLPLWIELVDMPEVVVCAVFSLLLGERRAEVVLEIAPERRDPRKSPAHLPLVVLKLLQRGDRLTNECNVAAVQVRDDTVEMVGDKGASGAALTLVGEPRAVAEHEVIDK